MTLGGISDGISNWERGDSATCVALFLRRLASTFVDFRATVFPFLFHRPFEPLKAPSRARSHPDRSSRGDPRAASVSLSLSPLVEPVRRPFEASPRQCRLVARTRRGPCIKPFFFAQRPLFQTRNMLPQRGNGPGRTASKRHKRQARNTAFRQRSGSPQSSKSPPARPLGPDRGMKEAGINSPKLPKIVVFSKDLCLPPKEFRSRVRPSARHRRNVSKANRTQPNPSAFRSCRRGRIRLARSSSSSYPLPARSPSADARPEGSLCIS